MSPMFFSFCYSLPTPPHNTRPSSYCLLALCMGYKYIHICETYIINNVTPINVIKQILKERKHYYSLEEKQPFKNKSCFIKKKVEKYRFKNSKIENED